MKTYNVNNTANVCDFSNEAVVMNVNRRYLAQVCAEKGLVRKIAKNKIDYTFVCDGNEIGFVRVAPSNNLKFYAGSKKGWINGEGHTHLFHTFEAAVRFATIH